MDPNRTPSANRQLGGLAATTSRVLLTTVITGMKLRRIME